MLFKKTMSRQVVICRNAKTHELFLRFNQLHISGKNERMKYLLFNEHEQ